VDLSVAIDGDQPQIVLVGVGHLGPHRRTDTVTGRHQVGVHRRAVLEAQYGTGPGRRVADAAPSKVDLHPVKRVQKRLSQLATLDPVRFAGLVGSGGQRK
jgi:hypothetical protein